MKTISRLFRYSIALACISCMCSATQVSAQDSVTEFWAFKEKRPLKVIESEIAVRRLADQSIPAVENARRTGALLARHGFSAADARPYDGVAWTFLNSIRSKGLLRNGQNLNPSNRDVVRRVAEDQDVLFASPILEDEDGNTLLVTNQIIIGFEDATSSTVIASVMAQLPGVVSKRAVGRKQRTFIVTLTCKDGFEVLKLANNFAVRDGVKMAAPSFGGLGSCNSNDPLFGDSWHLKNTGQFSGVSGFDLNAESAWTVTTGNSSVTVVVLDSGVQQNHPDINQIGGADFTDSPVSPAGSPGGANENHGTAVAGCISGVINNNLGTSGIAPGVKVASARIGRSYTTQGAFYTEDSWVADAIYWAESIGARVTNNSNFMPTSFTGVAGAYEETRGKKKSVSTVPSTTANAVDPGVLHFTATGNSGADSIGYPASLPTVVAVGATTRYAQRATTSQYGTGIDLMAPGEEIRTTDRTGSAGYHPTDYVNVNGTSFASPLAAGVAALLASQNPSWSATAIELRMQTTTTKYWSGTYPNTTYGWGQVNAGAALAQDYWQLYNESSRGATNVAGETPILGFVISGSASKKMLLRCVGPELTSFGVSGAVSNSELQLYNSSQTQIGSNDNWNSATNADEIRATANDVGAFPLTEGGNSASLLLSLAPGAYTFHARGKNGESGVVLGELYDAEANSGSMLINISCRTYIGSGSSVLIPGLVIQGNASRGVLVRGVGPELAVFGLSAIANPKLTILRKNVDNSYTTIASNDSWGSNGDEAQIQNASSSVFAFPLTSGSNSAALVLNLAPATYTVVVEGVSGSTGVGIAEVYLLN